MWTRIGIKYFQYSSFFCSARSQFRRNREQQQPQPHRQLEEKKQCIRAELCEKQHEADKKQKEIELDTKRVEALLRERDILNKNVIKTDDKTKKVVELVYPNKRAITNLCKPTSDEYRIRLSLNTITDPAQGALRGEFEEGHPAVVQRLDKTWRRKIKALISYDFENAEKIN